MTHQPVLDSQGEEGRRGGPEKPARDGVHHRAAAGRRGACRVGT
jgi:hypothetical protein